MTEVFTNLHLVDYCNKVVNKLYYWYGTYGKSCTTSLYNKKKAQYPSHYTSSRKATYKKHIAAKGNAVDCIGLIKGYMWSSGGDSILSSIGTTTEPKLVYQSNGCADRSANGMFSWAKTQKMDNGAIATMPEIPGLAVRFDGHVGIYIGNGYVVEARGFNYGVVKTSLKSRGWTHWYKLPFITYLKNEDTKPAELGSRDLSKGLKGPDVTDLQNILVYDLNLNLGKFGPKKDGVDGKYGDKTVSAVKTVQGLLGVSKNGIYTTTIHSLLMIYLGDTEEQEENEPEPEKKTMLECTGGSVYIREGNGTEYSINTKTSRGNTFSPVLGKDLSPLVSENNWYPIKINGKICWISGKYVKIVKT